MAIDPRKLRPSELVRLLNSTALGEVINERQLYRHRSRAGFRIGDGKTVDLLKYVAWLVQERHKPEAELTGDPYETLKDRARARNAALSLAGRDIGELPTVVNPERKLQAASDFRHFCVVYQFCRQSSHAALLLPSHGRFVGASSIPFSEYKRKRGDQLGHNWRIPNVRGKRAVRHVLFDANYWKTFLQARFAVAMGDRGCLSLFGNNADRHRLFAEHLSAEYCVKTQGRGRTVDEWKHRPDKFDNHWLDCLVGCAVAASLQGVSLSAIEKPKPKYKREKIGLAEMRRRAREKQRLLDREARRT